MAQYEVLPGKTGWNWQYRTDEGKVSVSGDGYPSRAEAITAARAARGDERLDVFRRDGSLYGVQVVRGGPERLLLLRGDGSVHGELDHELREGGGPAQTVSITPASETAEVP